ncbi:hypothetical protein AAVH_27105 [Aphelenchoides avenae]|nr:hypothetical protein AAVH_27105 [Aphelenchus avenae]
MNVMLQYLPFISMSTVFVDGVASGHDQVHRLLEITPGLHEALFGNDVNHPNAAAVLSVCAARRVPNATLKFAADVTDAEILEFLFNNNSANTPREFSIAYLRRSLSNSFFESIVEGCRRNDCKSLAVCIGSILTDPTDEKYVRYVVECDDRAAMYKFRKAGPTDHPTTIVVGMNASKLFYLKVFQGDANDLCSSIDVALKIRTGRMTR